MESYSESLLALPMAVVVSALIAIGLVLGSFLNVVILRLPRMMEREWHDACLESMGQEPPARAPWHLAVPGSHCPHCEHPLRWFELIPLLSWLGLRRRCRYCHAPISWQYPLIEAASALLLILCWWRFGLSLEFVTASIFCLSLLALACIDLRTLLLPDQITLPLLWLGLILAALQMGPVSPAGAIIAASAGYMALWLLAYGYRRITGREGMGHGDFKLLAALGAWLGPQALPSLVLIASVLGLMVGLWLIWRGQATGRTPLPFGPCLAIAAVVQRLGFGI